jgi:hypothetical protein
MDEERERMIVPSRSRLRALLMPAIASAISTCCEGIGVSVSNGTLGNLAGMDLEAEQLNCADTRESMEGERRMKNTMSTGLY